MYDQQLGTAQPPRRPPAQPTPTPAADREISLDEWEIEAFKRAGVPENLRRAVADQESGGDVNAVSPTGVRGRYGMTQATARQYNLDRNDPWQQPVAAAKHLRALYDQAGHVKNEKERWLNAVSRYYGGDDAVSSDGVLSTKTRDGLSNPAIHSERVAKRWADLERANSLPTTGQQPPAIGQPSAVNQPPFVSQSPSSSRRGKDRPGEWFVPPIYMGSETDPEKQKADKGSWSRGHWQNYDPAIDEAEGQQVEAARASRAIPPASGKVSPTPGRGNAFNQAKPVQAESPARQRLAEAFNFRPAGGGNVLVEEETKRVNRRVEDAVRSNRRDGYVPPQLVAQEIRGEMQQQGREAAKENKLGKVGRFVAGAGSPVVRGVAGLASLPSRAGALLDGEEYNPLDSPTALKIGAIADVLEGASQPTNEQSGLLSAGGLGQIGGTVAMALGPGKVASKLIPGAGVLSAAGRGAAGGAATMGVTAAGEPISNADVGKRTGIGAVSGAAGGALGAAGSRAIPAVAQKAGVDLASGAGRHVAPAATVGSEAIGGGLGNVAQAVMEGRTDQETLTREFMLGAAMSGGLSIPAARAQMRARSQRPGAMGQDSSIAEPVADAPPTTDVQRFIESPSLFDLATRPRPARNPGLAGSPTPSPEALELAGQSAPRVMPQRPVRQRAQLPPDAELVTDLNATPADHQIEANQAAVLAGRYERAGKPEEAARQYQFAYDNLNQARLKADEATTPTDLATIKGKMTVLAKRIEALRAENEAAPLPPRYVVKSSDENVPAASSDGDGRYRAIQVPTGEIPVIPRSARSGDSNAPNTGAGERQPSASLRIVERTRQKAESLIGEGRYDEAVAELQANRQALRDAKTAAKKQPGERVRLERQIGQVSNQIGEVRQMARAVTKQANAPTAGIPQRASRSSQPATAPPARVETLPVDAPLLGAEAVINPEGGIPRNRSNSINFAKLAERSAQQRADAPKSGKTPTAELTIAGMIKRRTGGQGFKASDRGEARALSGREGSLVGLVNRGSRYGVDDVAVILNEEGFRLPDGRPFVEDGRVVATEGEILDFIGSRGRQKAANDTASLDQRLADEEARYYEEQAARGNGELRRDSERLPESAPLPEVERAPSRRLNAPEEVDAEALADVEGYLRGESSPTAEAAPRFPRRPLPPSQPRGNHGRIAPPTAKEGAQFAQSRRSLVEEGKRIRREIEYGLADAGEHGRIAQQLFKSSSGKVAHGHDSFLHDPSVKGALGLSRDAEMGDVRREVKRQLARSLNLPVDEMSLTQASPDVWRQWARQKKLSTAAREKLEIAIKRATGEDSAPVEASQASRVITLDKVSIAPEVAGRHIGKKFDLDDIAGIVGAPDGSELRIQRGTHKSGQPAIKVDVFHPEVGNMKREVYTDKDGSLVISNDQLQKSLNVGPQWGLKIIDRQIEAAQRLGVSRIEAVASGKPESFRNGYYTLAKWGFDGQLKPEWMKDAPRHLRDATTVQELFQRPGGAQWWKENGQAFEAHLDVASLPTAAQRPKPKYVAEAEARLKETMSGRRAGSGAESLIDLTVVAGHRIYRAGMGFGEFVQKMIKEAGERVRPHLRAAYQKLQDSFSFGPIPETRGGTVLGAGFGGLESLGRGRKSSKESQPPAASEETPRQPRRPLVTGPSLVRKPTGETATPPRAQRQARSHSTALRPSPLPNIANVPRSGLLETVAALRKAGLLTGVKTHLRNVGGTAAFQGIEELARIPASMADLAISAVTKQRTITGVSARAVSQAGYDAATKGVREAVEILRKGATAQQLSALQVPNELNSGSKILDTYVNGVFRTLAAEDKIFRTYALRRSLESRAEAMARTEARAGQIPRKDIAKRAKQLVANPPADMEAGAVYDAEVATFNNDNLVSRAVGSARQELDKTRAGRVANFGIDMVVPFIKTPTNIMARLFEMSPGGYAKNAYQVAEAISKKAFSADQQRAFAHTFGRASVGSALMWLGYTLGQKGVMAGLGSENEAERNRDTAVGRPPMALRVGDEWLQVGSLAPIGSLLAIGAAISDAEKADDDKKPARQLAIGAKVISEFPMLQASREMVEAVRSPGRASDKAGRMAGSFVPTIINDVGDLTDSKRRQPKGFTEQIQKRIPGLRNSLPEATDVLGRPLEHRKSAAIDPFLRRTARETKSPLEGEFVRLNVGLTGIEKRKGETPEQFTKRKRSAGRTFLEYASALVDSPEYGDAADDERKGALIYLQGLSHRNAISGIEPDQGDPAVVFEKVRLAAERKALRESREEELR